jgi:serine/threonine-protein kinase
VLLRRLATGGMAEIFHARKEGPEGFARDLVVKRILPHLAEDPQFTAMFLVEARIAARLTHPNVVQVYDFGEVDGIFYLVMELVRGIDLQGLTRRAMERTGRGIPPHHAAKILSFVCEGLAHAHAITVDGKPLGLVHRDITPSNVLVSFEGAVKVADFGIAKLQLDGSRKELTQHGRVRGKYAYLSPEQARAKPLDGRSDLWNVGILLFEAVTGDYLYPHGNPVAAKHMSALGEIPDPSRIDLLPPELAAVVRRALRRSPDERYPDALSLRADLEAYLRRAPDPSDSVELGRLVRELCPDVVEEDRRAPRAAGTVPKTQSVMVASPEAGGAAPGTEPEREERSDQPTVVRPPPTTVERPRGRSRPPAPPEAMPPRAPPPAPLSALTPAETFEPITSIYDASDPLLESRERDVPTDLTDAVAVPDEAPPAPAGGLRPAHIALAAAAAALLMALGAGGYLALAADSDPDPPSPRIVPRAAEPLEVRRDVPEVTIASPPVEAEGRLTVETSPAGARVLVDGAEVGRTPLRNAQVARGEHELRVELEGHLAQERTITVEPGESVAIPLVLEREAPDEEETVAVVEDGRGRDRDRDRDRDRRPPPGEPGTLRLASSPWSEVYLNGRSLGPTPLVRPLPAGTYVLSLRPEGRLPAKTVRVTIRPGEETRLRPTL